MREKIFFARTKNSGKTCLFSWKYHEHGSQYTTIKGLSVIKFRLNFANRNKKGKKDMAKIAESLLDLIGNTPLVELGKIEKEYKLPAKVIAKVESFNPLRSVKDRVGFAMLKAAAQKGIIDNHTVIIEPTSGNTGIGLAFAAAILGYHIILTMPDSMTIERRTLVRALGAEVVLTPAYEGMPGSIRKAQELSRAIPNSYIPEQFDNPANPAIHYRTTGPEIWSETDGKIDLFVAGIGTGGTISGVGEYLKRQNAAVKIIGVEPFDSPVLSGGKSGPHKIQGIGAGFIPEVLDRNAYDEIFRVKNEDAFRTVRLLARKEGVLAGISSGAALYAAIEIAKRPENAGKQIVVLLPDTGERYLSTPVFSEE